MKFRLPPLSLPPVLFLPLVVVLLTGCSLPTSPGPDASSGNDEYVGRLEAVGMTSYMYGSHVLLTESGRYAVNRKENAAFSLDDFTGKRVRVEAKRVEGYPVDGGPPLLAVRSLTVIE